MCKSIRIEIDGRHCVGLDVGDRSSYFHVEDARGNVVDKGKVRTDPDSVRELFGKMESARIALEVGTHSAWLADLLTRLGHEVTVANPNKVALIAKNYRKGDEVDAALLCWLLRVDRRLLFPIQHRGLQGRAHLTEIDARDTFVKARTRMINFVRGKVKTFASRVPSSVTPSCFHKKAGRYIPACLQSALTPMLELIGELTERIREQEKKIKELCREQYPETKYLESVNGVGPITALTFILVIEDPSRFDTPREVGPYLGLVPRRHSSGKLDPELSISKAGNGALRRLLVQCSHHILGPKGRDSDVRRWGAALAARGKKGAKKRAAVAVARKLAVILLSLWVNEQKYRPLKRKTAVKKGKAA